MDNSEALEIAAMDGPNPNVDYYQTEVEVREESNHGKRFAKGCFFLGSTKLGGNFVIP